MDHLAFVPSQYDVAAQAKRLNAVARCMSVYQQGLLTMRKLRQGGHQRISVQYVKVTEGARQSSATYKIQNMNDMPCV